METVLIAIIFLLLAVLITGTAIILVIMYRKLRHAVIVSDHAAEEQINIYKALSALSDRVNAGTSNQPTDDNKRATRREEQFARMMGLVPPSGINFSGSVGVNDD